VRYQLVPEAGEQLLTMRKERTKRKLPGDEIKARVQPLPLLSRYMLKSAEHGDRIMILQSRGQTIGNEFFLQARNQEADTKHSREDRTLVFNPSNVTDGIETADLCPVFIRRHSEYQRKERDVASVAGN